MQKNQPWRLIFASSLLALAGLIAVIMVHAQYQNALFWVTLVLFLAACGWLGYEIYLIRKNTLRYIARMNTTLTRTMQTAPVHMPVPLVIADHRHEIIWFNDIFAELFAGGRDIFGLQLQAVLPFRPDAIGDGESTELGIFDRQYRVSRTDYSRKDGQAVLYSFEDISNYVTLRRVYLDTPPACC